MEISFSLADLFYDTFGYRTRAFDPDFDPVSGIEPPNRVDAGQLGSPYYGANALGREVFLPVTFSYPSQTGSGTGLVTYDGPMQDWVLNCCVVSVSGRKTIVETPLTERRGTVKELVSIEDHQIRIKGFLIGAGNDFPEQDVSRLRDLYESNIPVSMKCALTDIFLLRPDRSGSDNVVIRELNFPAVTGVRNVRPFELLCVSDEPFSLVDVS
jgi:Domain of unknown function (DUF6046)